MYIYIYTNHHNIKGAVVLTHQYFLVHQLCKYRHLDHNVGFGPVEYHAVPPFDSQVGEHTFT